MGKQLNTNRALTPEQIIARGKAQQAALPLYAQQVSKGERGQAGPYYLTKKYLTMRKIIKLNL